jgi:hypothetical protein
LPELYNALAGASVANGLYTVTDIGSGSTNWVLTRATDTDGSPEGEVTYGLHSFIEEGTDNNFSGWVVYGGSGVIHIGHDEIEFTQFQGLPQFSAGTGIDSTQLSSNVIQVDLKANGGLVIESNEVAVDLAASSITGTLAVGDGGTGATTLTDGGILLGSGTGAVTATAQPTNGQLLVGSTGVDPVLATLSGTASEIDITNGAGSITVGISASYVGQTSITTLGTITTGTWNGTVIGAAYGGTGIDTSSSTGVPYVSSGTWATEASLDETRGGTGQTSYATGEILYASASNTLSKLTAGTLTQQLTVDASGLPSWSTSNFQEPVISVATSTSAPPTEVAGDRYIISADGAPDAGWDSGAQGDIVEFNGSTWIVVYDASASEGGVTWVNDQDALYTHATGTTWSGIDASVTLQEAYDNSTTPTITATSAKGGLQVSVVDTNDISGATYPNVFQAIAAATGGGTAEADSVLSVQSVDVSGTVIINESIADIGNGTGVTAANDVVDISNNGTLTSGHLLDIRNNTAGVVGGSSLVKISNENTSETDVNYLEINGTAAVASTVPALKFNMNTAHAAADIQLLSRTADPANLDAGGIWYNSTTERITTSDGTDTWGLAQKYVDATVGDGASTDIVITHNLNTRDVSVTVYETGSPYAEVIPDIEHTSTDTITLKFGSAPASNEYTCVVTG